MTLREARIAIEDLINAFAGMNDDDYLEALNEMTERSSDAFNARQEELGE